MLINNSLNLDVIFLPPTKASSLHKMTNLILGEYLDKEDGRMDDVYEI
jgi:hypothetical protein